VTPVDLAGWAAVIAVLAIYSTGRPRWFDLANVYLCIPVALPALLAGAYPSGAISLCFGAIGGWHLWKRR
jgi:hypothetical protein